MTEIHQTSLLQSHRSNDRVFIGLAWVWIAYAVLNILTWRHSASSFSVDLMPLLAGALIIPFGWHAGRLDREIRDAVDALDDGAALVFGSEEGKSHDEFFADLHATIRRWSWRLAVGVVFVILVAMVSQVREELQEGSTTAVDVGIFLALTSVMSGAGAIIELLLDADLGRWAGSGRLQGALDGSIHGNVGDLVDALPSDRRLAQWKIPNDDR